MFNPKLKQYGENKLVYTTPLSFRIVFLAIAVFIIFSVISAAEGPLLARFNGVSLIIILICVFASLYLERWVFDKTTNTFEKNLGVLFYYSRKIIPLDALSKVVLYEPGVKSVERPKYARFMVRKAALVALLDQNGNLYKLDMLKGSSVTQAKKIAESLSMFCEIPLEDKTDDVSEDALR